MGRPLSRRAGGFFTKSRIGWRTAATSSAGTARFSVPMRRAAKIGEAECGDHRQAQREYLHLARAVERCGGPRRAPHLADQAAGDLETMAVTFLPRRSSGDSGTPPGQTGFGPQSFSESTKTGAIGGE